MGPPHKPDGNPEAIRRKAADLKGDARRLRSQFDGLPAVASSVEFLSDAGDRWRGHLRECARNAQTYADQCDELAGDLIKEANRLEEDLLIWRVRFDRWLRKVHPELAPPEGVA